jgi:hypothetical protein
MARYRWVTITVTSFCLLLSAVTILFEFTAFTDYRTADFIQASEGPITGTCVEAVTDDQLKSARYDRADWACSDRNKERLANLLAASVHALYYANSTNSLDGDSQYVLASLVATTTGDPQTPSLEFTKTHAYNALRTLNGLTFANVDCDTIYMYHNASSALRDGIQRPPARPPAVVCDDGSDDIRIQQAYPSSSMGDDMTTSILHAHCHEQFSYGRSRQDDGTFGIPKVGEEVAPLLLPVVGTNHSTSWENRVRILIGTRWGYASIVYILFAMGSAFFFMDCTIFLLADITRIDAYEAQSALVDGSSSRMKEGMMTMLATFQSKRDLRWATSILILMFEIVLWLLLIGIPWSFGATLPRPICEDGAADHWFAPFHPTTNGGWKLDHDALTLDVLVLASHITIAIAVPVAATERRGSSESAGKRARVGTGDTRGYTGVAVDSLRTSLWLSALLAGAIVFYVGQAVAGFGFGVAWAEGVGMDTHSEILIGAILHDHMNAVIYMSMTVGLTLGSIVGRWLLAGLSCTSFAIFLVWVGLTVGGFIPPFFVSTYWVFFSFDDSQGQRDCRAMFEENPENSFQFASIACDIRAGTYITGILLLLVAALGPIFVGLIDYTRVICLPRRRAWVDVPDHVINTPHLALLHVLTLWRLCVCVLVIASQWRRLVDPSNPRFRTLSSVACENGHSGVGPFDVADTQSSFRSTHTEFFNYSTRLTVPAVLTR